MRENSKPANREDQEASLNAAYHDVFEVHLLGQKVFDDLYRRFAARARVHTDGGIDAVLKTYKDAAQRDVLEYIVKRINQHNGVNDQEQTDAQDPEAYSPQ